MTDARAPRDDAARKNFSWLVSHTLGGATHSIIGALMLLDDTQPGETLSARQRDLVTMANGSAIRLRQLSEDIELLTHLEAGTVQAQREDVPVTTLLREAIEQAQKPSAPNPPREIPSTVTRGLPLLVCDRTLMRRALAAIIENALRFSASDTPITIAARKQGTRVRFHIQNEGPGVAPENVERIFEPLYVGARPRSHAGVGLGLGLGLAVARACAETHGGHVWLESPDVDGVTFLLEIPFTPPSSVERAPSA